MSIDFSGDIFPSGYEGHWAGPRLDVEDGAIFSVLALPVYSLFSLKKKSLRKPVDSSQICV